MNRRFVVRKDTLAYIFSILLLVIYAFSTGLGPTIYRSGALLYGTFAISILVLFGVTSKYRTITRFTPNEAFAGLIILLMILNNNANIKHGAYEQLFFSITFYLVFIAINRSCDWIKITLSIICPIGIFYAAATYFFRINSGAYYSIVVPLFSNHTSFYQQNYAYLNGFMNGFTPNSAINAFYIICSIGILTTTLIAGEKRYKGIKTGCIVFLTGALLMTGKRAHLLFAILAIVVVYFGSSKKDVLKKYFKFFMIVAVGLIIFVIAAQYIPSLLSVFNKFEMQASEGRLDSGRFIMWTQAFEFFKKNLFFGVGWDGFKYSYSILSGSTLNVHNVYIQILTEMGVIGAIPFFLFFVNTFRHAIKALKSNCDMDKGTVDIKAAIMFAVFIQIFFLLYCLTGNPLYDATTLFMYLLSCAIGDYFYYHPITD